MKIVLALILIAVIVVVVAGCKRRGSADKGSLTPSTTSRYKAGQVWSFHAPADQPGASLIILRVESHSKLGTIVHIALVGLSLPNGGTNVQHMPFAEAALDKSVVSLVREGEQVPDFQAGYNEWRQAFDSGHAGVFTGTVAECFEGMRKAIMKQAVQP